MFVEILSFVFLELLVYYNFLREVGEGGNLVIHLALGR